MTSTQAQIISLIAQLSVAERQELLEHLHETHLLEGGLYDRLNDEQRAELDAAIAEADAGKVSPAEDVFARLASRFGFGRP